MSAIQRFIRLLAGRRSKWVVLGAWLVVFMAVGPLSGELNSVQQNDAIQWLPRTAESTKSFEKLSTFTAGQSLPAVVVYARESGVTEADKAAIEQDRTALAGLAEGGQIAPAVPSEDGKAVLLNIPLPQTDDSEGLEKWADQISAEAENGAPPGLESRLTGPAGTVLDIVESFSGLDLTLLLATAGVVTLLLLLIYRSPVLWLLPLIAVSVASTLGMAVVYLMAKADLLVVNGQSAGVLTVLTFGAGTDYALLLLARYREELHRHEDRHEAMFMALRHSGPAILASVATVVAGLLCLLAAELNSNRGMGPVGAAGILAAFLCMMTLLPALLVAFGRWVFWPFVPKAGTPTREEKSIWGRVSAFVGRRPRAIWVTTAVVLAACIFGLSGMKTGIAGEDMYRTETESIKGQKLVSAHFPAGAAVPADVVANAGSAEAVAAAAQSTPGVSGVLPATRSGTLAHIPVVLADPPDSTAAKDTIDRLRDRVHAVPGADALVGGPTATALDTDRAVSRDRNVIIPLVLAVVFLILMLLLRSIVAPVMLMATVVLSFFAALGICVLLFRHVFGFPAIDSSLQLLGFIFLVALGVDYNIFLMHRVREEVGRHGHRAGVLRGLTVTGGVITSAGLVLAATFSVLAVLPLVSMIQQGVLIAVGVLVDTFIVRSLLVPALCLQFGRRTWWPGELGKRSDPEVEAVPENEQKPAVSTA
nr:lipoprotein [uncultured bacterium]